MKKTFLSIILIFCASAFSFAQNARQILDDMAKTINSYKSVSIDFAMTHEDHQNNVNENENGRVIAKDTDFRKFKMTMDNSDVYCNGTTKWAYLKDVEEIDITGVDLESDDMTDNPVKFFTVNRNDMKYSYKQTITENQKQLYEVDFYPKDLNAAYSIIRLHIEKGTNYPRMIKYFGKDGNNYIIKITKITPNLTFDDSVFTLDTSKYPNAEVVDLR